MERNFVPGVYMLTERSGDAKSPVVYCDGKHWWIPGWECQLELSDTDCSFKIDARKIGDLIWEDKGRPLEKE